MTALVSPAALPVSTQLAPLVLRHVVLFTLKDSADRPALEQDCDRLLPSIPGVIEYSLGRPIDTGRSTVDGTYDLAVYLGFASIKEYRGYLVHPQHVALVAAWNGKFESVRVFDFGCDHE